MIYFVCMCSCVRAPPLVLGNWFAVIAKGSPEFIAGATAAVLPEVE